MGEVLETGVNLLSLGLLGLESVPAVCLSSPLTSHTQKPSLRRVVAVGGNGGLAY